MAGIGSCVGPFLLKKSRLIKLLNPITVELSLLFFVDLELICYVSMLTISESELLSFSIIMLSLLVTFFSTCELSMGGSARFKVGIRYANGENLTLLYFYMVMI